MLFSPSLALSFGNIDPASFVLQLDMQKGRFTILWSCSGFRDLQYLSHRVFLTSLSHLNCSTMCNTASVTAPECSVLSCRSWCLTTSAKFCPLAGDFLDDKHLHGSWSSRFKSVSRGKQFILSFCASWPGEVAGRPSNSKAEGSFLELHTLFGEKSTSPPEVCLNPLYHKEHSPSRLLAYMLLYEFLQQEVKRRKKPQSICDHFSSAGDHPWLLSQDCSEFLDAVVEAEKA